jgi:hypothetical protein
MQISARVEGLEPLLKKLESLQKKVAKKILKQAVTAGGRDVRQIEKVLAPTSAESRSTRVSSLEMTDARLVHGLLRLSIDVKVKMFRSGVVVAVIGPRTNFANDKKTRQRKLTGFGKRAQRLAAKHGGALAAKQSPANYAHLAGPHRKQVFMTKAAEQAAQQAGDTIRRVIEEGILEAVR